MSTNREPYVNWTINVNLSPPKPCGCGVLFQEKQPQILDDHGQLKKYYNTLQQILYETGQPETFDRTASPRKHCNEECVNVAILSSPVECIGILLEGGNHLPGGFHLVLSTSWLSTSPSEEDSSLNTLLLHKAISFHANGATFIDEFEPPQRVTYFVNNFTDCVDTDNPDGDIETKLALDCPMGSSAKLCEIVDDTVWTRDIMAEAGLKIPQTLAIRRAPRRNIVFENNITCIDFESYDALDIAKVEKEIKAFSKRLLHSNKLMIVVKASGQRYQGKLDMSIHKCDDVVSIVKSAKELLQKLEKGYSVVVEEYVKSILPFNLDPKQSIIWAANDALEFQTHVTVCRDHDGMPLTTLIKCVITERLSTISDENMAWQSLDSTLLAFNVFDESLRRDIDREIRVLAAAVFKVNDRREQLLTIDERGSKGAQTDIIGIDMKVTFNEGKLVPVGTKFSNRRYGTFTQKYDFMIHLKDTMFVHRSGETKNLNRHNKTSQVKCNDMNRNGNKQDMQEMKGCISPTGPITVADETENGFIRDMYSIQESRNHSLITAPLGAGVRPLVRNMITRSQRYIMKGKQIVVIAACSYSKRKMLSAANSFGLKVILVDSDPNNKARDQVHHFIHYDFDDHSKDVEHAVKITNMLEVQCFEPAGCLTIWEACVSLVALINKRLGTKGDEYEATLTARKKSRTQNVINSRRADIPHWPRANLYSSLSFHLKAEADIASIPESFKFPAMLKLENGMFAVGAARVKSKEELKKRYAEVSESLQSDSDLKDTGRNHINSMMAMEFYEGSEHSIDVLLYDRKLMGAFVTDCGRVRRPYFTTTAKCMPSNLPQDKQAQLIMATYQCCTEIGLSNGIYNVEMMMTATGPKLLEINARMGGFCFRNWTSKLFGVDPVLYAMMIACDIKPYIPKQPADSVLMGVMLLPSVHAKLWENERFRNQLNQLTETKEVFFTLFSDQVEAADPGYDIPFANVAVSAHTMEQAKRKLVDICYTLGINKENFCVEEFLQIFV